MGEIELLDNEGYPTEPFLKFIREYHPDQLEILHFLNFLEDGWYFRDWGFKLHRKYRGIRKLELHTGGWSGKSSQSVASAPPEALLRAAARRRTSASWSASPSR